MPFNPTEPQNGEVVDADFLRSQFNSLKTLIDVVPGGSTPTLAQVLSAGNDAGAGAIVFAGHSVGSAYGGLNINGNAGYATFSIGTVDNGHYGASSVQVHVDGVAGNLTLQSRDDAGISLTTYDAASGDPRALLSISSGPTLQLVAHGARAYLTGLTTPVADADAASKGYLDNALAGLLTTAAGYTAANPGHWVATPPATLAAAIDRLATLLSAGGATPIP